MIDYITEKVKNTPKHFRFGGINVVQIDTLPSNVDINAVFKAIEGAMPSHYFSKLKGVNIQHHDFFETRDASAVYKDGVLHITNQQDNSADLINDICHEFGHHIEELYPSHIYEDTEVAKEFISKRNQVKTEIQSEGYWVTEYDFNDLEYNKKFDNFLYRRLGKNMLQMVTAGIFVRPYSAVSLREYFATGFEAYYCGQKESLYKVSPILYKKVDNLHNLV
tara:strand:- start:878 stop:1540 length:663 start_codon:yes stop_codon:yes gene_type:complete